MLDPSASQCLFGASSYPANFDLKPFRSTALPSRIAHPCPLDVGFELIKGVSVRPTLVSMCLPMLGSVAETGLL